MAMKSIIGQWLKGKKKAVLSGFWQRVKSLPEAIKIGIGAEILMDGFDVFSTILVLGLVASASESNPYMVDAVGKLIVSKMFLIKGFGLLANGLLAYILQRAFKDARLSCIPFLYTAFECFEAAFHNFLILFGHI